MSRRRQRIGRAVSLTGEPSSAFSSQQSTSSDGFHSIPESLLVSTMEYLTVSDLNKLACVDSRLREVTAWNEVWECRAKEDFLASAPASTEDSMRSSYKARYLQHLQRMRAAAENRRVQKEQRERTAAQSRRRSHPVSALLPAKYRGRLSDEEFASVVMWMHIGLGAALACLTVYMRSFVWMYIVSWWMWWTPLAFRTVAWLGSFLYIGLSMAQPPEHARWMFVHARAIFCAAMVVNLGMEWFLSSSPPLLLLRLLLKLVPPWLLLAPVVFIFAQAWLMQRFFLNQRQSNAWAFAVTIVASLIIAVVKPLQVTWHPGVFLTLVWVERVAATFFTGLFTFALCGTTYDYYRRGRRFEVPLLFIAPGIFAIAYLIEWFYSYMGVRPLWTFRVSEVFGGFLILLKCVGDVISFGLFPFAIGSFASLVIRLPWSEAFRNDREFQVFLCIVCPILIAALTLVNVFLHQLELPNDLGWQIVYEIAASPMQAIAAVAPSVSSSTVTADTLSDFAETVSSLSGP